MTQQTPDVSPPPAPARAGGGLRNRLRAEAALLGSGGTCLLFLTIGAGWLYDLASPAWAGVLFVWLFAVMLWSSFSIVRHAEELAHTLGEPVGTLILTLAVISIEVMMISALMLTPGKTPDPALARDTMFAVIMIVMNGMGGATLLLGGLRYHEQEYNLQGAQAFLSVILPLAVLGLVLPTHTEAVPGPVLSSSQSVFLVVMAVALYAVFLAIQTSRHPGYFKDIAAGHGDPGSAAHHGGHGGHSPGPGSVWLHAALLLVYLIPLVLLSKKMAAVLEFGTGRLGAPRAFAGFVVATLVLAPEGLGAFRAALANQMQRACNILLGSVVSSVALTIPAALTIGLVTGQRVELGLPPADQLLLVLTLGLSILTYSSGKTNILLGAVHLVLFMSYVMLIFER